MAEENKTARAQQVYQTLCNAIDNKNWKYEKKEDEFIVHFRVSGDDLPITCILIVDADRELVRLLSPLPFKMDEDKRMEGAIAACVASYGMVDGSFDYDIKEGDITFRMTACYRNSSIGEGLLHYLIDCACTMIDTYNDRFFALNKGFISISDFIEKEQN